ncbi:Uncharacterized membrane protein YeiB [Streptomyces sp. cf386]|uniref:DUF418 domain-containing protein n=1 Tax=Streptomyces sp. cf386 TaxID=1761904 RepID=UPI00088D2AA2|nr:DUF418 domain-containing protein [Streptomyces sp. cf386]SDN27687.1 Uncharacterized membrane protein YeiB [Streptomyces sp. cf386]
MSGNTCSAVPSTVTPTLGIGSPALPAPTPSTVRLIGIDLARGVAVLGMYAAHVGPDPSVGGPVGFLLELARGRSAALFAVLAGFTLVIITGRPSPRTGRDGRQAAGRVVIRAIVLMALGFALTALDTSVEVILAFYGLVFLAVLPLYRLRATTLAVIAAVGALILPQVLYVIQQSIYEGSWSDTVIAWDPLARFTDSDGFMELLFTGEYPVLTWASFMIAGMALARLDLTDAKVRTRLALTGGALAVVGYGGSWLALHLVPQAGTVIADATDGGSASSAWWSDTVGQIEDSTPPEWLLVAAPHSQTTFSILGNTGVALVVVAACVTVAYRAPRVTRLLRPVAAVGMVALSTYVLHIVAIRVFGESDGSPPALLVLSAYIAGAMVFAMVWTRLFRRGPLEYLLHTATRPARHIR